MLKLKIRNIEQNYVGRCKKLLFSLLTFIYFIKTLSIGEKKNPNKKNANDRQQSKKNKYEKKHRHSHREKVRMHEKNKIKIINMQNMVLFLLMVRCDAFCPILVSRFHALFDRYFELAE